MAATSQVMLSEAVYHNRFSAEFFDPQYVFKPSALSTWLPIGRILKKCEYGISISMNVEGNGYPIFRMNEIENCFAQRPEKHAAIPKFIFEQYRLNENDILFNRTNSFEFVGRTGIVIDQTDCTFASYLIRLVPDPDIILPEFLTVYLNTKFGVGQIKRRAMRSINQANVSGAEVKRILIPIIDLGEQQKVANVLNESFYATRKSERLYADAQHLLESELGLDKLSFQKPVGYTARFSELEQSRRMDADYFQVSFRQIQSHLNKLETVSLYQLAEIVKGIEVGSQAYTQTGIPFLRVSNVKENSVDLGSSDKYISEKLYRNLISYHPQVGELLLTKDGTPGICYAIDQEIDGIISGGIVRLIFRDTGIPKEYIALAINSKACRMQIEQDCSGALIVHWKPSSIRKLRIPLISTERMLKIDELVTKSKQAMRDSARLLDQSKTRVEQLIEEAVRR